jgi:hypothetical protein
MLSAATTPLATGQVERPTWLPDGRLWYRTNTRTGAAFVLVDPARHTRVPLLDADRLTASLAATTGQSAESSRACSARSRCAPTCAPSPSPSARARALPVISRPTPAPRTGAAAVGGAVPTLPANARRSPDGRWAAYVRAHDLWARELGTGRDLQLTTDGIADFGYATDNVGVYHSDEPVLTWSPDSRRIATFQQDERGVSTMYLVRAGVGPPRLEAWKYPFAGDSVVTRVHRVVVNVDSAAGPGWCGCRCRPTPPGRPG